MDNNIEQFINRRKYVRVLYTQDILCDSFILPNEDETVELAEPFKFRAVDISVSGMGITSYYSVDVGTIIIFPYMIDTIKYEIRARVVYCVHDKDQYHMGIDFLSTDKKFEEHIKRFVTRLSFNGLDRKD